MTTYATWNPDDKSAYYNLSNGNLTATSASSSWKSARGTIGKSSGKWYWEITINVGNAQMIGVGNVGANINGYCGVDAYGWSYHYYGRKYHSGSYSAYGDSFTAGAVIGVALDMDNGKLWWSKNGVWQGSGDPETGANPAYSGLSGAIYPMVSSNVNGNQVTANFGASSFSYSAPSGFNSGLFEDSQAELEDASLDLAAYYRGMDDLGSFLRAHDGIELHDLLGKLEAAAWNIEDLAGFLSAYYEGMDDAGMDLDTWGTHYDDLKAFLSAWFQHLEDMGIDLETWATGYANGKTFMWAAAFAFKDLQTWLAANAQALASLGARLETGKHAFGNLELFLSATDGIVLNNMGCFLYAGSGIVQNDLGCFLRAISSLPVFGSTIAQRVSSVVSEVA